MSLQNLFVAKLPRNIGDADLLHIFSEFHPSSAKIMLDASTGKSKGFGFVLFDEESNGEKAYKALNRKMTRACGHNFTLVIYPSNHDGKIFTEETNALYIRNIPMTVGQDRVERFLRTFGNLTYFAMREDHYGSPVWVIYAEYETVEEAKNALTKLHGNNTYFHGSAPILAKFEDSDDAKKERRRRREGAQNHVPSSGCIFPPPRDHHEGGSSLHTNPSTTLGSEAGSFPHSHGVQLESQKAPVVGSCEASSPHLLTGEGAAMPSHMLAPSPPSYVASLNDVPPMAPQPTAFSMPQHLLQPTPGYCYTLAESGQQIFIPATSFSPPVPSFTYSPVAQSAPAVPHMGPPVAASPAPKQSFSLLNPESNNAVVLMDGGHQYVVAPDAINLHRDKLSTPGGTMPTTLLSGSQPKSLSPAASNNASYMNGGASAFSTHMMSSSQALYPSSSLTAASPSFMVTQTSRSPGSTPMVFVPYTSS